MRYVLLALALTGCATTPSPTEALAPGNFQARLTHGGAGLAGDAVRVGGSGEGETCILTLLGLPPAGAVVHLEAGECSLSVGGADGGN